MERDEEQAGVELAALGVEAVGERVAAAQDLLAVVRDRRSRRTCASRGQRRRQVDRIVLGAPAERRAASLDAPDRRPPGRTATRGPRPRSACGSGGPPGRCRRASTRARSRARPRRARAALASSSAREVVGAVLEAHEVARRGLRAGGARRAAEPELRPAHDHDAAADAGQVAHGVEGDLRVVGAGLDAEVAARARGLELVARQRRQLAQRAAAARPPSPNRPSNSDGPSPNVTVSRAAGSPTASPVSTGGASGSSVLGPAGSPAVIRAAAAVQARSRSCRSARARRDDVEGREVQAVLRGRDDARLVRAVERDGLPPGPPSRRRDEAPTSPAAASARGARARCQRRRKPRRLDPASAAASCGGDLRERLGERVHELAQPPALRRAHGRRSWDEAVAAAVKPSSAALTVCEARVDLVASAASCVRSAGRAARTRPARRRRWPRSPTGRCASSGPPRR